MRGPSDAGSPDLEPRRVETMESPRVNDSHGRAIPADSRGRAPPRRKGFPRPSSACNEAVRRSAPAGVFGVRADPGAGVALTCTVASPGDAWRNLEMSTEDRIEHDAWGDIPV